MACVARLEPFVLLPLAIGYTVFAIACWPRGNGFSPASHEPAAGVLGFAAWNVLAVVTSNGLLQLTMISAQVTSSAHDAGVYAAALTLTAPVSMLGQALGQVLAPAALLTAGGSRQVALASAAGFVVGVGLVEALAPVAGGTTGFFVRSAVNLASVVRLGVRQAPPDHAELPRQG